MKYTKGNLYQVISVDDKHPASKRLVEMGFTEDVVFLVEKTAPFGDPLMIHIRGYHLALRRRDLQAVHAKPCLQKGATA